MTDMTTLRRDLAAALNLADEFGFSEGICNHFSVTVPDQADRYLINPYGLHWSEIRPHHLLLIDGAGEVLEGEGDVEPTALYIHVAGHRANPRHRAILHTHMPYTTALTMVNGGKLEMAHQTAVQFWGRMAHHSFGGIALEASEGERIAAAQTENPHADIVFLDNHGVTVCGENIAVAFNDLYYLERACRQQVLAQSTGLPLKIIPDGMIRETHRQYEQIRIPSAELYFKALLRSRGLDT